MRLSVIYLFSFLCFFALSSAANEPIGTVKTYRPEASIIRGGAKMPMNAGSEVRSGDRLITQSGGAIGIVFVDGSVLSLGPKSEYLIEGFEFQPAVKNVSFLSVIERGTATFISGAIGRISPEAVKFKTPTATLGLRGTKVLIEVK